MFIDKCKIELKAGNGGDGIVAWRREAHYPEGGPWGGNGGNGGNIFIAGDHNQNSLFELRNIKKITAQNGFKGGNKLCHGANGIDYIVKVPLGTVIKNISDNSLIADIVSHGQKILICKGGKGGFGNAHFKSSYNKTPKLFEKGDVGEIKKIFLEIKYLSDVGILGLPNAGKSTLISKISNAKPKIASYKFTTLSPVLGTVEKNKLKIVFADIPGLIEGAASGVGLGLDFLKHIERCQILIHLISGSKTDNESSVQAYETVLNEINKYNIDIQKKQTFIAVSKKDQEGFKELLKELKTYLPNQKIYEINSLFEYPNELINDIFEQYKNDLQKASEKKQDHNDGHLIIKIEKEAKDELNISKIDKDVWEVSSNKIRYWTDKIPLITDDNIVRFCQKVEVEKIIDLVKEAGGKSQDNIIIGNYEYLID